MVMARRMQVPKVQAKHRLVAVSLALGPHEPLRPKGVGSGSVNAGRMSVLRLDDRRDLTPDVTSRTGAIVDCRAPMQGRSSRVLARVGCSLHLGRCFRQRLQWRRSLCDVDAWSRKIDPAVFLVGSPTLAPLRWTPVGSVAWIWLSLLPELKVVGMHSSVQPQARKAPVWTTGMRSSAVVALANRRDVHSHLAVDS